MLHVFTALGQSFPYNDNTSKHIQTLEEAAVDYAIVDTKNFTNLDWEYLAAVQPHLIMNIAKQKQQNHENRLSAN